MSNRRAENTSNANGFLASGPDILPHPLNTSERSCDPSERSHDPIASIATHHFCSICDVNCNSPANLLTHCKGRRHRESVKIALRGASLYAEDFKKALSFKAGLDFLSEMRTQAPHGWQDFINAVRRGTRALQRLDFESYPGEPQEESAPTAVTQLHHVCSICVVNCNSSANLLAHSRSQKHHESVKTALRGATLLANHFKNALSPETKPQFSSDLELSSEAPEIFTAIALAAEVGPPHSRPWPFNMQVHMWRQLTDAVLEGGSGLQQLNREDYVLHYADLGMTVSPSVMGIDGVDVSTALSSTDEGDDEVILDFDCYGDFDHLGFDDLAGLEDFF